MNHPRSAFGAPPPGGAAGGPAEPDPRRPLDVWLDAGAVADLPADAGLGVGVAGRDIALFRVGEAVYAIDNLCTHDFATLCDGFLEGHEIECPLHQARFDLRTGAATCAPAVEAVRTYPVRIEGGRVLLAIGTD